MRRHHQHRRIELRPETLRHLTHHDLALVAGGLRETRSEEDGGGPCPGQHTWTCQTG